MIIRLPGLFNVHWPCSNHWPCILASLHLPSTNVTLPVYVDMVTWMPLVTIEVRLVCAEPRSRCNTDFQIRAQIREWHIGHLARDLRDVRHLSTNSVNNCTGFRWWLGTWGVSWGRLNKRSLLRSTMRVLSLLYIYIYIYIYITQTMLTV